MQVARPLYSIRKKRLAEKIRKTCNFARDLRKTKSYFVSLH